MYGKHIAYSLSLSPALGLSLTDAHNVIISTTLTILSVTQFKNLKQLHDFSQAM